MKTFSISVIIILMIVCSCNDNGPSTLYYTSFEQEHDLKPWQGTNATMLVKEAPVSGGDQSLRIGGGCLQPASTMRVIIPESGNYRLTFWARMVTGASAGITVRYPDQETDVASVGITGYDWAPYVSGSFHLNAGDAINVEIYAGGIVLAETEIDLLSMEKTE